MATAGALNVYLNAKTMAFNRNMSRSGKHIRSVGKASKWARGAVLKLGGAFAAFVGARALIGWTKGVMASYDAIGKLADRTQISTEALIGWGHAAQLAGSDAESLNKSLEMFTRRLGEARIGRGEMLPGLKALKMDLKEIMKASPEEAFKRVVEEIRKIPNAAAKAQAAYSMFGRQGQQLLNLIEQGRAGLDAAVRSGIESGTALTREQIREIEKVNDAWTEISRTVKGVGMGIMTWIVPAVGKFTDQLYEAKQLAEALRSDSQKIGAFWKAAENLAAFGGKGLKAIGKGEGKDAIELMSTIPWDALVPDEKLLGTIKAIDALGKAYTAAGSLSAHMTQMQIDGIWEVREALKKRWEVLDKIAKTSAALDAQRVKSEADFGKKLQATADARAEIHRLDTQRMRTEHALGLRMHFEPAAKAKQERPGLPGAIESRFLQRAGRGMDPVAKAAQEHAQRDRKREIQLATLIRKTGGVPAARFG